MSTLSHDPLLDYLKQLNALGKTINLLDWDAKVGLPEKAHEERSYQIATLSKIDHDMSTSTTLKRLLDEYKPETELEKKLYKRALKDYNEAIRFPEGFSEEFALTTSRATTSWQTARAQNDHTLFLPDFIKVVELVKQKAEYIGYKNHPYDALLSEYDEDLSSEKIQTIIAKLQPSLQHIQKKIAKNDLFSKPFSANNLSIEGQQRFTNTVLQAFGYDFLAGREDVSLHPFTTSLGSFDTRITSHYKNNSLFGIFASFHEGGHGIYDQNISSHLHHTPLAYAASLSIHESQSRLWENLVGRSYAFWQYYFPILQQQLPEVLSSYSLDQFYREINCVQQSSIRVEADEVTYNAHVMLRTDLEMRLLEGTLDPQETGQAWNEAMRKYLGIAPQDDNHGFLQDIHWSMGYFGYFPTYMMGNILAAQLFSEMSKTIDTEAVMRAGDFSRIREWLTQNIHQHGNLYGTDELLMRSTHNSVDPTYFINYLNNKYLS